MSLINNIEDLILPISDGDDWSYMLANMNISGYHYKLIIFRTRQSVDPVVDFLMEIPYHSFQSRCHNACELIISEFDKDKNNRYVYIIFKYVDSSRRIDKLKYNIGHFESAYNIETNINRLRMYNIEFLQDINEHYLFEFITNYK